MQLVTIFINDIYALTIIIIGYYLLGMIGIKYQFF